MIRYSLLILSLCICAVLLNGQETDSEAVTGFSNEDSLRLKSLPETEAINSFLEQEASAAGSMPVGGIVSSIFREALDSVRIVATVNGAEKVTTQSDLGWFFIPGLKTGSLVDLHISHSDYHAFDTSFIVAEESPQALVISLIPKYRLVIRGRVYAGNLPLAGANVQVGYRGDTLYTTTRDCYYDEDDYWNCLYHGMFRVELTAEEPEDSIYIRITREGMISLAYTIRVDDYQGEITKIQMKYNRALPEVSQNYSALKLSFPFVSMHNDWFVSLSYHRLFNTTSLRRFGAGIDVNSYITIFTVEHETLQGLGTATFDSSYISVFIGPSLMFWIIPPEKRYLSTYAGLALSWQFGKSVVIPQPYIGTRVFLDLNKSLSLELRYANYKDDIRYYTFNNYGNADSYVSSTTLEKLSLNFGIQVVF